MYLPQVIWNVVIGTRARSLRVDIGTLLSEVRGYRSLERGHRNIERGLKYVDRGALTSKQINMVMDSANKNSRDIKGSM